jgi:hypothetical protein
MALAGVTTRISKGSKLTIVELDNNFNIITSSVETSTTNITTINNRVTQSLLAFPNLLVGANGPGAAGLFTSGALFVTGALSVSGSQTYSGSANFLGRVVASGSGNSVLGSNYADDVAAAIGLVPIGGFYHTNGTVKIRQA